MCNDMCGCKEVIDLKCRWKVEIHEINDKDPTQDTVIGTEIKHAVAGHNTQKDALLLARLMLLNTKKKEGYHYRVGLIDIKTGTCKISVGD